MMQDLTARLITALLLGPLVIAAIWIGGIWFLILLALIGLALIWEWGRLIDDRAFPLLTALYMAALFGTLIVLWQDTALDLRSLVMIGLAAMGSLVIAAIRWHKVFLSFIGVIYLIMPLILLADLRSDASHGVIALLAFVFMVWASDVGAYFAGRFWGGKKLAPTISENKTWSGALGGVSTSVLLAGAAMYIFSLSPWLLLWGGFISITTQAGDLLESSLKRRHQVKDMSGLLPGHGGFLDRMDGLIFTLFIFYLLLWLMGWPDQSAATLFLRVS